MIAIKALVVAGGMPQIELIRQLKERGIETVLADGSPAPLAKPFADRFHQVNIFDTDALCAIAVEEKADFLITVCADQVLLAVAQASERLGLPWYIDERTARMVSDKELMKKTFAENGIPTSRYEVMAELDTERIADLRYPLIVKPVDAYSSRGVRKVLDEAELRAAFADAVRISRNGNAIVEEFFRGEEISVDLFVEDGKAHVLCVSNSEKVKAEDRFVIFRGRYPVHASEALLEEIRTVCQKIADAFGLRNCPMLVQMLTDGERISVLEFCARTGGAMKWLLIKHASGVDVIKGVIDLTLGIKPSIRVGQPESRYIVNDFVYCGAGVFDRTEGFDEALRSGLITDCRMLRPKGHRFSGDVASSSDRLLGVTFQADTLEDFNRKHRAFVTSVKVLDTEGNDMMRHDLLPELEE